MGIENGKTFLRGRIRIGAQVDPQTAVQTPEVQNALRAVNRRPC